MTKHRKKFTDRQLTERAKIEKELSAIPPLNPAIKKLTSAEGFADYYLRMRDLYDTQQEAYERLEDFHIAITGRRRYSEYNSFRIIFNRIIKNYRKTLLTKNI